MHIYVYIIKEIIFNVYMHIYKNVCSFVLHKYPILDKSHQYNSQWRKPVINIYHTI